MKNRFLLLLLLLCTFGLAGNSVCQTTPHWGTIPMQIGGNNMTIFSTLYIDGVQVNNANYEIAAFMEGFQGQYDEANNEYGRVQMVGSFPKSNGTINYYTSNVFGADTDQEGNVPTMNRATFKIYDHETGAVLDLISTYEWYFTPNATIGSPNNPIPLTFFTEEPTWELVTDASTLAEGDVIAITNTDAESPKGLGERQSYDDDAEEYYRRGYDITFSGSTFTFEDPAPYYSDDDAEWVYTYAVQEILVHYDEYSSELPTLFATTGYFYAGSGSKSSLRVSYTVNDNCLWSISSNDDGTANIVAQGSGNRKTLRVKSNGRFSCYASTAQNPVRIYRKVVASAPAQFTVNATASPVDGGSIQVGGTAFTTGTYDQGTTLSLTAVPADGMQFSHWTINGTDAGNTNPLSVTVDGNKEIVAYFEAIPVNYYTLTVNVDPVGAGTYTVSPTPGEQGFEENTSITVTASANDGYEFVEWQSATDATLGNEASYTFTITANTTLYAIFQAVTVLEPYTVTFNAGSGTCSVTSLTETAGGAGITLPEATPCDAAVTAGWTFAGWATAAVPETTTAPELLNGTYYPEANITLYAVYMMGGQTYTFKNGENYLNWTSGNTLSLATAVNDNTSWNVTFNGNIAKISPVTQEVEREIAWNNQNNGQKFAAYKCTSLYNNDGNMSANYGAITLFKNGTAVTSIAENDVVVLASETVKKELNTVGTSGGTGADYTDVPNGVLPLTVGINGEPAVYNTNPSCEGPVVTQNPVITPGSGTITTPTVTVEITCPTEGAVIYYTLDGTTPTAESTVYSAPIVISETTTVSAIAIVAGGEPSEVVSCTYTFPTYVDYANIKAFKDAYDATSSEIARITGDVTFVFRNGNYMYVQDATAGLLIFDNNNIITNTYNNGDVISGGIIGTMSVYYGQKELKPTVNPAEGVAGTAVEPTPVTVAAVLADYNSYDAKFVKMESVTFTEGHTFTNSGAGRSATIAQDGNTYTVYNQFKTVDLTVEAEQEANVIGFIGVYNDTKQIYPRDNEDIELVTPVEPETVTINATANPAVGGTVTGAQQYEVGATVTLTATAAEGYEFVNWTEGENIVGTNATLTFTAAIDRDLVANFQEVVTPPEPTYVTINATANPAIGGTVTGAQQYEVGATVTLTATAAEGYEFVNWTEGETILGTDATLTFTAEANRDLVANFQEVVTPPEPTYVTINATANPAIGGTVSGANTYEVGATVTLNATAAEGYHFVSWTENGAFVTSNASYTFTAAVDRTLVANFEEDAPVEPETYTITVLEAENGVITAPASAQAGATVTVEATPSPLHILSSLYFYTTDPEDVTEIDLTTMQFEMPAADVTIGATFSSTASLGDANDDGDVNILDVLTALNYILGKNPQPFDFEQADMNADGVIDIADAMAINALIHGMKGDCGDMMALYDVVDGVLTIESDYALAGYQFNLSAEPASIELTGFTTMGNWVNGEYILVVFNLNGEKEAGLYEVLNLIDAQVNSVSLSTLSGCKVIAERGTLSVNNLEANFNVYPVPAKEVVTVEGEGINFIEVYNVMGQRVMTAYTTQVNVSNLAAGTYMFRINTENGQVTKNVVVVK